MTVPHCSLVIRAFNEGGHIGRLLEGIRQQTMTNYEVIVVDSGSTDDTVEISQSWGANVVHISPELFTFGYSLNQGLAQAQGEIAVIASAHVYPVYPDWLERLIAPFEDPQIGLTYGRQTGHATSKFSELQIFESWYPNQSQPRQYHPFCNNANAAVRLALWRQHPYDETLPGLEDLAWARWMMAQGYALAYVAEAEIVHVHQETPRGVFNRYRREAMAYKRIFPEEHFHITTFIRLFTGSVLSDIWHAIHRRDRLSRHWRSILWFRWMQFWGTYQGYRQSGPLTWRLRQVFYYPKGILPGTPHLPAPRSVKPIDYQVQEKP